MKRNRRVPLNELVFEDVGRSEEDYFGVGGPSLDVSLVLVEETLFQTLSKVAQPHLIYYFNY